ncbi:MAG: signal peptidase I [Bacilli bacterium]|nr:signal peptidase I [Bacilli bacterium]
MKLLKEIYPYLIAILIVVLIRSFIITPVKVSGQSMYPTFEGSEILLLNKLSDIDRYDVVVLKRASNSDHLIKRVYGLPGENIKVKDNKVYIDGKAIADDYGYGVTNDFAEVKLGKDEYFVLGDNRIISLDSRSIGAVKKDNISGRIIYSIFPFGSIKG